MNTKKTSVDQETEKYVNAYTQKLSDQGIDVSEQNQQEIAEAFKWGWRTALLHLITYTNAN